MSNGIKLLAVALLALAASPCCAQCPICLRKCLSEIPGKPEVLYPGSNNYELLANNLRIIRLHNPAAVMYPTTSQQVQAAVSCAVSSNVQPLARSGGCSFEALSTADGALVIDLSSMDDVSSDAASMTAVVQPGIRTGNLYQALYNAGRAAGLNLTTLGVVWPQVGFGGVMTTGGYGSLSRKYGVLADFILSAKVVTADGKLLDASPTVNPDLFWAIRGGGGGTYGIVTEATVKLVNVPRVATGYVKYSGLDDLVDVLDKFQRWAPTAPPELWFSFSMTRGSMNLQLLHQGTSSELRQLIKSSGLAEFPSATVNLIDCSMQGARWSLYNDNKPLACNPDTTVPQRLAPGNFLAQDREASKYKSAFVRSYIPRAQLAEIRQLLNAPGRFWRMFLWTAYGGAFETKPEDFNAFPYRKGILLQLEYGTSFGRGHSADQVAERAGGDAFEKAVWAWYQEARKVVAKFETGEHEVGHLSLDDNIASYFGPNYQRLRTIKKKYDPKNVFRNALSVPPAA